MCYRVTWKLSTYRIATLMKKDSGGTLAGPTNQARFSSDEGGNLDACKGYAKMLYHSEDMAVVPVAGDLASLGRDLLIVAAGYERLADSPLIGSGVPCASPVANWSMSLPGPS